MSWDPTGIPTGAPDAGAPLVSILLATRNGARFLPEALRSIEAQTHRPIELVAVNDGSTDATEEILRAFAAARPWVRVVRAEGVGAAGARALAFAASRGVLLAIHDDDDVSRPDRLALQVAHLAAHPEIGVVGSAAEMIDEEGGAAGPYAAPLTARAIRRTLRRAPPFVHGSVLLRREAYVAAGGFRAAFACAEDYDLWLRVPERFGMANLAAPLYRWRAHPGNSFSRARDLHLEFLALARAFADERRVRGEDSIAALPTRAGPDAAAALESFRLGYPLRDRLALYRGEALAREGRSGAARAALGPALRSARTAPAAAAWWLLAALVALTPRGRRADAGRGSEANRRAGADRRPGASWR